MITGHINSTASVDAIKDERKLAIRAAKDFMEYGEPGYNQELIDALKVAQTSAEIRELLRKARAVA